MEEILECSCGLDVHKDKIEACIMKTGAGSAYRETFGCIASELDRMCRWLNVHGCRNIAMESTGVYWLPVYERIEEKCDPCESLLVVNAYEIKNMPGRKTDVKDAEWLAQLLKSAIGDGSPLRSAPWMQQSPVPLIEVFMSAHPHQYGDRSMI